MASIRTSPLAMQLQDLDRLLDEADGKLETVRFAVARSQRLHSRLRQFVADTKEAFEQGQARPLGPQELDALRNTVQATTQLFNMLSKISIYDYFVATNRWNTDVLTLSSNVGIMRRQSGLLGRTAAAAEADEDARDGQQDRTAFSTLIRSIGGQREAMKREAQSLTSRDADALCKVIKQVRETPRGRGMGFEALFLRNAVQMLQAQAGLATPLSPLVNSFPSSYMPPAPPSPATSVSMPRRRNSFSQSSSLSMSDPTRSNNPQPASFFLTNPYQTGPSEMQRPMSSMTPPSAGRRAHFADEPSSFRQGAASLFAAGPSNEDILKAARPPPGPSPHPGHSRNTSSLPTPPHTPQRRSSGSETVLEWEDVRTGRQVTWKPFEGWKFWQEPAWLTRADGVDREELSVGKRAIVVSGWRAATGPLAKAITGQAVPPSALQRLHVEVGSPIVVLGLFKMRDEIYVAAYSRRRVAENGLCAYGLLPLSTVSVTGRKPETHPLVYDTSLHESAFGFEAWVRSTNGLAPVEGVITGEPRPALLMQRTDDESSALPGPLGAVMRVDLQRVTVAKKRPEVRELLDSFGARQRQTLWVFEVRTQENLGSQTKELLFKREPWIDEIIFAARRVCPTLQLSVEGL